jgi:uncharacterized membrane protein
MAASIERTYTGYRPPLHPLHAFLRAATVPLFLGALLSDIAYFYSHQVQWLNFASWLIAGGLMFGAFALLWAIVDLFGKRRARALPAFVLVLATWIVGFIDALIHARDAWAVMPTGLVLSVLVVILAIAATWLGFASLRDADLRDAYVRDVGLRDAGRLDTRLRTGGVA